MRNKKAVLAAGITAAALLCAVLVFSNVKPHHSGNASRVVTVESASDSDAGSYVTEEKGNREAGKSGTGSASKNGSSGSSSADYTDESIYSDYQSSYPDRSVYDDRVNAKNYGDPDYKILQYLNFIYDSDEAQSANQQLVSAFSALGIDLTKYPDAEIEAGPAYSNVSHAATTYRSSYVTINGKTYTVILRMQNAADVPYITVKEGKVSDDDLKKTADSAQSSTLSSIPVSGVPDSVLQTLGLSADDLAKGIAGAEQKAGASYTSLTFSEVALDTPERYTIEVTLDDPSDLRTIRVSLNRASGDITYIP